MASNLISCRWDWCRSSFSSIDALDAHVKHEHIWPMKPMRKADIALMRRMDLQSLHSSLDTDSSIIPRGLNASMPRKQTRPLTASPTNDAFDTFTQLSSPPQAHFTESLSASPAFEGLVEQDVHSSLSAAVEVFERVHAHQENPRFHLPPHQRSPTCRPLSDSSGSSQEIVALELTQDDDVASQPQLPLSSELQVDNELVDAELRWPTDDELDAVASGGISNSGKPASRQDDYRGISPDLARGRNFRHGSLDVPLAANGHNASPPWVSQGSQSQSQQIVLQTQAPYSSQTTGWSQTE